MARDRAVERRGQRRRIDPHTGHLLTQITDAFCVAFLDGVGGGVGRAEIVDALEPNYGSYAGQARDVAVEPRQRAGAAGEGVCRCVFGWPDHLVSADSLVYDDAIVAISC